MTHDHSTTPLGLGPTLDCAAFELHLAEYLEGDLSPPLRAAADAHRDGCAACAALVAELEAVRDTAARLPVLRPSRDLWDGVAARISAPVVPIAVASPPSTAVRRAWLRRPRTAAAAALLLVGSTAALTYAVASRSTSDGPAAPAPTVAAVPSAASPVASTSGLAPEPPSAPVPVTAPATPEPRARSAPSTRLATNGAAATASPYDAEIAQLRAVLERRSGTLDTATVRVVRRNLAIIDQAIRESRAALAGDPSNQFLDGQLNDMLGEKLELMRTAVLLSGADD